MPGVLREGRGGAPFRPRLLSPGRAAEGAQEVAIFEPVSLEEWREGVFDLLWRQHGGSGLNVTYDQVLDMSVADHAWFVHRVREQRQREADAIEKASKGK